MVSFELLLNAAKLVAVDDRMLLHPQLPEDERADLEAERSEMAALLEEHGHYDPDIHGPPHPEASTPAKLLHARRVGLELQRNVLREAVGE